MVGRCRGHAAWVSCPGSTCFALAVALSVTEKAPQETTKTTYRQLRSEINVRTMNDGSSEASGPGSGRSTVEDGSDKWLSEKWTTWYRAGLVPCVRALDPCGINEFQVRFTQHGQDDSITNEEIEHAWRSTASPWRHGRRCSPRRKVRRGPRQGNRPPCCCWVNAPGAVQLNFGRAGYRTARSSTRRDGWNH
jgi:hypothetical protein